MKQIFCVLGWVSGGVWFSNKISFLPTFIILSYNPSLIRWWFELSLNSFPFVVQFCVIFGYSVLFKCNNASYWYGTGRLRQLWPNYGCWVERYQLCFVLLGFLEIKWFNLSLDLHHNRKISMLLIYLLVVECDWADAIHVQTRLLLKLVMFVLWFCD